MGHSIIAIVADLYGHIFEGQDRVAVNLFSIALCEVFREVATSR
jgi:hypothetical protein